MDLPAAVTDHHPFDAATIQDPYPWYAALRASAPVYRPPGCDVTYITRHADIAALATDTARVSSRIVAILVAQGEETLVLDKPDVGDLGPVDVLAITDPPDHGAQRRALNQVVTRGWVASLEPWVRALVRAHLDAAGARCDWMQAVASPIPVRVMAELLGLPAAAAPQLKVWSDHAVALLAGVNTPEALGEHMQAGLAFHLWLADAFADPPASTLSDALSAARRDGHITQQELVSIAMQLIIAGSDSSASTMGSAVWMLGRDPALQQALRDDPSKIPAFVEEVLRLESPFQGHFRITTDTVEVAGSPIGAGTRLMLMWGSGNRDEAVHDRPDQVDLERPRLRKHQAFGYGLHRCLGAGLARLEVRVVLEELLAGPPFAVEARPRWRHSAFVRTLEQLPLER